jgi:hypothetical protein
MTFSKVYSAFWGATRLVYCAIHAFVKLCQAPQHVYVNLICLPRSGRVIVVLVVVIIVLGLAFVLTVVFVVQIKLPHPPSSVALI